MKKKLTNTRVINSIGIGILAMVTAGTPVLAEINDAMNDNSTADTNVSDIPAEHVEQEAPSQNEQILQALTDTQSVIQEVRDNLTQAPESSMVDTEGTGAQIEISPSEDTAGTENTTPSDTMEPADTVPMPSDTMVPTDVPKTPVEEGTQGEKIVTQQPVEGEDTGIMSVEPQEETGDVGKDGNSREAELNKGTTAPMIDDYLKDTNDALEEIKNDIGKLDQKNNEAKEAIDEYKEAVNNPNNFIGSIVDQVADASSAATDAADSVIEDEAAARDQAQIAVDAQNKEYASREEAEAAQQQAQEAALAAEEAYRSAQAAVEEAEANKTIAGENVENLKRLRDEAALALEEMNAKVGAAQELLRTILTDYGFDAGSITPGTFDKNQLEGGAKKAYESAEKALEQAAAEQSAAQKDYDTAVGEVVKAEKDFQVSADALSGLLTGLETAKNEAETSMGKLKQADYDVVYAEYKDKVVGLGSVNLDLAEAKEQLATAQAALEKAKDVKDKTDQIVANAEETVRVANTKIEDAENEKLKVEQAINDTAEHLKEALKQTEEAEKAVGEAKDEARRAVECLQSVRAEALKANENLEVARAEKAVAVTKYEEKLREREAAEEALQKAKDELLNDVMKNVLEAQKKAVSGGEKEISELAKALILYFNSKDDSRKVESMEDVNSEGNSEIKVTFSDDTTESYYFSKEVDGIKISLVDNLESFSEQDFKADMVKWENFYSINYSDEQEVLKKAQEEFKEAEKTLNDAENKVTAALKAKGEADEQVKVVEALEEMAGALETVHENVVELLKAEKNYQENFEKDKVNIVDKLENLISKRPNLDQANANLANVNQAKDAVDQAITELTNLSAQENADQNAYYSLVNAYNAAKADYDEALEALEKCVVGRNRAETEKNRARAAADAIFRYVSGEDNVQPTQPQPVNPIQPVYGTLIDTVTTPIIANRGVPTGTGYTGYTYTIGGQPAYTVGETTAPEEETADELVNVEDSAIPLAAVGENNKNKTTNTKNTRAVSDEKIPLDDMKTENNKASWWWILVIALLGATGTEMYIRHKEKTEQERKSKTGKQSYAKI